MVLERYFLVCAISDACFARIGTYLKRKMDGNLRHERLLTLCLNFKMRLSNSSSVRTGDRKEMTTCKIRPMPFDPGKVNVFTDGSKTDCSSGAAYVIKGHAIQTLEYFNFGE